MRIDRAFCVELGRIVTIYEARALYFSQVPPRKRFNFLCSDKKCRDAKQTKITAVNYDKIVDEGNHYLRPHFRTNGKHILNCEWLRGLTEIEEETTNRGDQSGSSDSNKDITAKSTNVVDIFSPGAAGTRSLENPSDRRTPQDSNATRQTERVQALRKRQNLNPNHTSFLDNVVDSYLALSSESRRFTYLKIGRSPRLSYRECFRPLKFYGRGGSRRNCIFYGSIGGRKVGSTFILFFYEQAEFGVVKRRVRLRIQQSYLDRQEHGSYIAGLMAEIVRRPGHPATCYFYGDIQASATDADLADVSVANLDNLVFKLKSKQRK